MTLSCPSDIKHQKQGHDDQGKGATYGENFRSETLCQTFLEIIVHDF